MEQPNLGYEGADKKVADVEAKMPFLEQQHHQVVYVMPQPPMMSYPPQPVMSHQHHNHEHSCPVHSKKQVKATGDGFPVSLPMVTQITAFFMGSIIIYCGYLGCTDGTFTCDDHSFPDISHVMGKAPLNKLYAIMLTWYACVKQSYVRAYHDRLQGIASPGTNKALLIYGAISCIFGPMIGFWDVYYDMHVHCFVVALFVIGEVLYILTMTAVLNETRPQWPQSVQGSIDNLVFCRLVTIVLGVTTLGAKVIGKDIDPYSAYIEWTLFNLSFYIFGVMSNIMPYEDVVVPEDSKEE
jgi:hypothetical protein